MMTIFGEIESGADLEARTIMHNLGKKYDIGHRYGTNRGLILTDNLGKECDHASKSGFYAVFGPKIVSKNVIDLNTSVCYYTGYAGSNNTIRIRLSRFLAEMLGNSYDTEPHAAAERLSYIVDASFSKLLSAYIMPYDITKWILYNTFRVEAAAWRQIETVLIAEFNPILNKKRK